MTWEERMSQRAAERMAKIEAEALIVEPLHPGHHEHLDGTAIFCSCGKFFGVTCVAFDSDYNPDELSCDICGMVGVIAIGVDE